LKIARALRPCSSLFDLETQTDAERDVR